MARRSGAERPAGDVPALLLAWPQARGGTLRTRLAAALREAVRSGRLPPGARLPSSRALAQDLGISRGSVVEAYAQLRDEGLLAGRPGSGTVVAAELAPRAADTGLPAPPDGPRLPAPLRLVPQLATEPDTELWRGSTLASPLDLRPGPPDLAAFPRALWSAATREVLQALPDAELGYVTPWGAPVLRDALAAQLRRARGAAVSAADLVVVSGVTQGLTLLVRVLAAAGHRELAIESPSNPVQRTVLGRYGLRLVDVAVDREGIDVSALARTRCRAVLVTPAHQYPCGVTLSSSRRAALLEWARSVDGLVLEDDYDSEFRYERNPPGCLQGLAPDRVALLGSVSKPLAPGLRLGWVAAPAAWRSELIRAKRDDDFGNAVLDQHVLARLLSTGRYDRHLRSVRLRYRERRTALVSALAGRLPDFAVEGGAAGLHLLVRLPAGVDEARLVTAAGGRGLALLGTAGMFGELPPVPGLVLGYARTPVGRLHDAVERLAEAADDARAQRVAPRTTAAVVWPPERGATAIDFFLPTDPRA